MKLTDPETTPRLAVEAALSPGPANTRTACVNGISVVVPIYNKIGKMIFEILARIYSSAGQRTDYSIRRMINLGCEAGFSAFMP